MATKVGALHDLMDPRDTLTTPSARNLNDLAYVHVRNI